MGRERERERGEQNCRHKQTLINNLQIICMQNKKNPNQILNHGEDTKLAYLIKQPYQLYYIIQHHHYHYHFNLSYNNNKYTQLHNNKIIIIIIYKSESNI